MLIFYYSIVFLVGLALGSFLNAWVFRTRENIRISKGRSMCIFCHRQLAWYENIPLFSFMPHLPQANFMAVPAGRAGFGRCFCFDRVVARGGRIRLDRAAFARLDFGIQFGIYFPLRFKIRRDFGRPDHSHGCSFVLFFHSARLAHMAKHVDRHCRRRRFIFISVFDFQRQVDWWRRYSSRIAYERNFGLAEYFGRSAFGVCFRRHNQHAFGLGQKNKPAKRDAVWHVFGLGDFCDDVFWRGDS